MSPFYADARYATADIFPMFDMPFLYGGGWSATEGERHARVAVIAKSLNDKLFGGANSVGKTVRLDKRSEEHTSELQSLMRISYAVFCLKKKKQKQKKTT